MATFSSWDALRTAIKDALATIIAGEPFVAETTMGAGPGSRSITIRTPAEAFDWLQKTYDLEALENAGDESVRVSYGRHRRFD